MNRTVNRFISALLVFIMLFNIFPFEVIAADEYLVTVKSQGLIFSQEYMIVVYYLKEGYNPEDAYKYQGEPNDPYDPRGDEVTFFGSYISIKGTKNFDLPPGISYVDSKPYEDYEKTFNIPEGKTRPLVISFEPQGTMVGNADGIWLVGPEKYHYFSFVFPDNTDGEDTGGGDTGGTEGGDTGGTGDGDIEGTPNENIDDKIPKIPKYYLNNTVLNNIL